MTIYDCILFFIIAICSVATGISVYKWWDWKRESNENLSLYLKEKEALDSVKAELDKKNEILEEKEAWGRVIKIEKVYSEPKEFECKFALHERFINDKELCKKLMVSEAARYLAEEFKKDPYLYTVFTERNFSVFQDFIKIKFRMLPYAEPASFNDIFEEEE